MTTSPRTSSTHQTDLWKSEFGDAWFQRNAASPDLLRPRLFLWGRILDRLHGATPRNILEVGCGHGLNLSALRLLCDSELWGVEPNAHARSLVVDANVLPPDRVLDGTVGTLPAADESFDLVFTYCVLIHVHPDHLLQACREIFRASRRHIVCIEYFSRTPESPQYRDQDNLLFKRDFGAFWMDNFPSLRCLDCGFAWKRITGLDDVTWWVFEKAD